ncbi:MAG: DNA polymerase III subunit delta [Candidatus Saccharimonadales bacterium]
MITTLAGENDFLRSQELDLLVQNFLDGYGDMGLERLDGEEAGFEKIREALQSLPFLASKKLVVLRTPSANKQFVERAENLLKDLPETTDVILVEPKLDKRSSYYKFLKKATDFKEFNALDENGLARWLAETANARGASSSSSGEQKFSVNDARFLVQRLGTNQELLKNSLDILLLSGDKITRKTIEQMTEPTPQSKVFDLLEAAFNGRTKLALELYDDQRAQKVEPLAIIAMIAWQLKVLATVKAAGQASPAEIAKQSKIKPYVISKNIGLARKLQLSQIKQLVRDLLELDVRLKSESIDADEALRLYLLKLN